MEYEFGHGLPRSTSQGPTGCNEGTSQAAFSSGVMTGEENTSKLALIVRRSHFFEVVGLKAQLLNVCQLEAIFGS